MATPTAASNNGSVSHQPYTPVVETVREHIDIGNFAVEANAFPYETPPVVTQNPEFSQRSTGLGEGVDPEPANVTQPKRSKAKARFAKRKILANSSLFLNPSYRGFFTDQLVEITGKIEECPRAVNSHRYRIDWRKNNGLPLPANLLPEYFQEYLPNTAETKSKLQEGIERFQEVYGTGHETVPNITANVDGQAVAVGMGSGTPPRIARGRAASAARTSAYSTVSSLSDEFSSSRRRVLRSETALEEPSLFDSGANSDIEDGDELDDEDDYQLRFMIPNL